MYLNGHSIAVDRTSPQWLISFVIGLALECLPLSLSFTPSLSYLFSCYPVFFLFLFVTSSILPDLSSAFPSHSSSPFIVISFSFFLILPFSSLFHSFFFSTPPPLSLLPLPLNFSLYIWNMYFWFDALAVNLRCRPLVLLSEERRHTYRSRLQQLIQYLRSIPGAQGALLRFLKHFTAVGNPVSSRDPYSLRVSRALIVLEGRKIEKHYLFFRFFRNETWTWLQTRSSILSCGTNILIYGLKSRHITGPL